MTLTVVMAVYGQPKMLAKQLETFASYHENIRQQVELIIIDDHGSPPAEVPKEIRQQVKVRLYRVVEDVAWNQMGARNWGMHYASEGPCVMLDPDMVISEGMMRRFLSVAAVLPRGKVIKFGLKHVSSGRLDYTSPNTWLLHKADFFACGGYDEEFRGHKGWSDCLLQETLRAFFRVREDKELHVDFYVPSDGFDDAMVLSLDRNVTHNRELKKRKNKLIDRVGGFKAYVRKRLKPKNFRCTTKQIF